MWPFRKPVAVLETEGVPDPAASLAEAHERVRRAHAHDAAAFREEQQYLRTHRPQRGPWLRNNAMMVPVNLRNDESAEARRVYRRKAATHQELMDALAARANVMRELGVAH
jgi:hypothetical protein